MPKIEPFDQHLEQCEFWFPRSCFAYESELRTVRLLIPSDGRVMEIGVGAARWLSRWGPSGSGPSWVVTMFSPLALIATKLLFAGNHWELSPSLS